jgi:hypothetical protein
MKDKQIFKALEELNLNNLGFGVSSAERCEPTAKLAAKATTLKGLNQCSGKILFSTLFPYRSCDIEFSYLFNP